MKYRMKPPTVDAEQWSGPGATVNGVAWSDTLQTYAVETANGITEIKPGDYVITLPDGTKSVSAGQRFERMWELGE